MSNFPRTLVAPKYDHGDEVTPPPSWGSHGMVGWLVKVSLDRLAGWLYWMGWVSWMIKGGSGPLTLSIYVPHSNLTHPNSLGDDDKWRWPALNQPDKLPKPNPTTTQPKSLTPNPKLNLN
jgi:hypothetical protein